MQAIGTSRFNLENDMTTEELETLQWDNSGSVKDHRNILEKALHDWESEGGGLGPSVEN